MSGPRIGMLAAVAAAAVASAPPVGAAGAAWPVARVARAVGPSVVGVVSERVRGTPAASGSGVVIRRGGYVVTNAHVVRGARRIRVVAANSRSFAARLVGTDPETDLAVLKTGAAGLRVARVADSSKLTVGELAVAIGNPMGLGFARSVTAGVVSGLDRSLGGGYARRVYDLIQTDAAINPGNSGGALADASGAVIGINSVKIAAPGVEGMGFAIPANTMRRVTAALIANGRVERAWLGVAVVSPEAAARAGMGPGRPAAPVVVRVAEGGPAGAAGMRPGDRLVAVAGTRLTRVEDLYRVLAGRRAGQRVAARVWRSGAARRLCVRLGSEPGRSTAQTAPVRGERRADPRRGGRPTRALPL